MALSLVDVASHERVLRTRLSASANFNSALTSYTTYGADLGMTPKIVAAHYWAQLAHESARFRYDREIWGPTAAQRRYDTRVDLGNTPEADGDGYLYRGRGPIQITGKANYADYSKWAKLRDASAPDFVANPDAVCSDPWEGLSPLWFWDTREMNKLALTSDVKAVTRRINGGYNGYADRLDLFVRYCLMLLRGTPDGGLVTLQQSVGVVPDGIFGRDTAAAVRKALE